MSLRIPEKVRGAENRRVSDLHGPKASIPCSHANWTAYLWGLLDPSSTTLPVWHRRPGDTLYALLVFMRSYPTHNNVGGCCAAHNIRRQQHEADFFSSGWAGNWLCVDPSSIINSSALCLHSQPMTCAILQFWQQSPLSWLVKC